MIQWMHRLSQSWVATVLMGALALSFVVWGIADVFTGGASTGVATIGSTEIDSATFQRSYRNYIRNQSQQMGSEITPEMAQRMGLGDVALQQLVSRTALDNEVSRLKLAVSDATLAADTRATQYFQGASGQFDHEMFLNRIQGSGYTEQDYLKEKRVDMARDQLIGAVEQNFTLPDNYAKALILFFTERRAADYVIVSPDSVGPIAAPSDAVLGAYVKAHPERFSTPEYRAIDYAFIGPQDIAGQVTVTDAMIQQDYDAHKATYQVAEKRDVQQIEYGSEADAAAARAKIDKGTTFDQLAAEKKLKPAELTLGTLAKSDLGDPARAEAAFALKEGEVSQPVKGVIGGFVLMRVTKITAGANHPLSEVHDTIKTNLALQLASAKLIDVINAFEDARSGGADIATAAKKNGLKVGHIAATDKTGLTPAGEKVADLPADPEFLTQAFAAEVGEDNDPFQAKSGEYYAVKITGTTPPHLKTLEQVKADASASWIQEQQGQALARKAAELASQAVKDKSLVNIAKTLKVPVQHSPGLTRQTSDTTFSANLVQRLFALPANGIEMGPQGTGLNYIIAQVTGISHAATPDIQATLDRGRAQLSGDAGSDLSISYANAGRLRQGVKVDEKMVQSVVGGNQ